MTMDMSGVEPQLRDIDGDQRAGNDARFEPTHEEICAEVAKIDAPTGGEPDWRRVLELAQSLLADQSKDLLIASYAAHAAYQATGLRGLAEQLWVLTELTDRFWDEAFPARKRMRARANALEWFIERTAPLLNEHEASQSEYGAVRALSDLSGRIRAIVAERYAEHAPSVRPLIDAIARLEMSLPVVQEEASAAGEPTSDNAARNEGASEVQPALTESESAAKDTRQPAERPSPVLQPESDEADGESSDSPTAALLHDLAELLHPLGGDAQTGADWRYEPDYEAIQAEIAKLESPLGAPPDWALVRTGAEHILRTASKDIVLACQLAAAYYELDQIGGLARGLILVAEVLDRFWDGAFPAKKRVRARVGAVDWLLERTTGLAEFNPKAADRMDILALEAASDRLISVCREYFDSPSPNTRPLRDSVQRLLLSLPKEQPPEPASPPPEHAMLRATADERPATESDKAPDPPAPKPETDASKAATPAVDKSSVQSSAELPPVHAAALANPEDLTQFLKGTGESLVKAGRELFKASSAIADGYRLTRLGLYLHLNQAPPTQSGNETMVPPPPEDFVKRLEAMANAGNWAALVEEAESSLPRMRFWVDLHRYVATALLNLGDSHRDAYQAVLLEVGHWLERMPGASSLSFKGGMPFASASTVDWIQSTVRKESSGLEVSPSVTTTVPGFDLSEMRRLIAQGKFDEATNELAAAEQTSSNRLERLEIRAAYAEALIASKTAVAEGIFRALSDECERYGIDDLHPKLAANCYSGWYKSLQAMAKSGGTRAGDPETAFRRLCAVDPAAAIKL